MSAALQARLAKLEAAAPVAPQRSITAMPYRADWHAYGELVAPGVYRVADRYRPGDWQVAYTSREALDSWLALPEQATALRCTYVIVTPEKVRDVLSELESDI